MLFRSSPAPAPPPAQTRIALSKTDSFVFQSVFTPTPDEEEIL